MARCTVPAPFRRGSLALKFEARCDLDVSSHPARAGRDSATRCPYHVPIKLRLPARHTPIIFKS